MYSCKKIKISFDFQAVQKTSAWGVHNPGKKCEGIPTLTPYSKIISELDGLGNDPVL